jgi:hypothetical protein
MVFARAISMADRPSLRAIHKDIEFEQDIQDSIPARPGTADIPVRKRAGLGARTFLRGPRPGWGAHVRKRARAR